MQAFAGKSTNVAQFMSPFQYAGSVVDEFRLKRLQKETPHPALSLDISHYREPELHENGRPTNSRPVIQEFFVAKRHTPSHQ
jgi:hypothetical protein